MRGLCYWKYRVFAEYNGGGVSLYVGAVMSGEYYGTEQGLKVRA